VARTTTDAKNWKFSFTVSEFARLLGKSPVTVRGWERKIPEFKLPRDGDDRRLTCNDVRKYTNIVYSMKRITKTRLYLVEAVVTLLELVEKENEDSSNRSARIRKDKAR
jgi:hypothetical protein